jgi:hypothetical protein
MTRFAGYDKSDAGGRAAIGYQSKLGFAVNQAIQCGLHGQLSIGRYERTATKASDPLLRVSAIDTALAAGISA